MRACATGCHAGLHDSDRGMICKQCRTELALGQWVAARQAEYQRKNQDVTIEQWEMDILNWLDDFKEEAEP